MCQKSNCPIHKLGLRTPDSWAPIWCLNCRGFHKLHRIQKATDIKRRISGRNVVTLGMWRLPGMLYLRALLVQRAPSGPMYEQRAVLSAGFCSLKWVKRILNWKWHLSYSQTNIALALLLFLRFPWCLSSSASTAQLFWDSLHRIDPKRKHVATEGVKETILCQSIHCIKRAGKWIHTCVTFLQGLTSFL